MIRMVTRSASSGRRSRKRNRRTCMAENQTKATKQSVTEFIAKIPDATRRADANTLAAMMQKVTKQKPVMWGPAIVGFGSYHYVYDTGREGDMPLVSFSPRKAGLVLYVNG